MRPDTLIWSKIGMGETSTLHSLEEIFLLPSYFVINMEIRGSAIHITIGAPPNSPMVDIIIKLEARRNLIFCFFKDQNKGKARSYIFSRGLFCSHFTRDLSLSLGPHDGTSGFIRKRRGDSS